MHNKLPYSPIFFLRFRFFLRKNRIFDKKSTFLTDYRNVAYLGINILSKNQINLSYHFATKKPKWNNTKY